MPRLALAGGTRVRTEPFTRWPDFDDRERTLLLEALEAREWGGYPFPNNLDELCTVEHRLIEPKSMNRADRDRALRD